METCEEIFKGSEGSSPLPSVSVSLRYYKNKKIKGGLISIILMKPGLPLIPRFRMPGKRQGAL